MLNIDYKYIDMFDLLDNIMSPATIKTKTPSGLKAIINRPHNLYTEKQDNVIVKYILETVYTPWSASDIKCKFNTDYDGQRLTITVGDSSKEQNKNGDQVYHGISNRMFTIDLPLIGIKVNPKDIVITAVDGILKVEIPVDRSDDVQLDIPVNA